MCRPQFFCCETCYFLELDYSIEEKKIRDGGTILFYPNLEMGARNVLAALVGLTVTWRSWSRSPISDIYLIVYTQSMTTTSPPHTV